MKVWSAVICISAALSIIALILSGGSRMAYEVEAVPLIAPFTVRYAIEPSRSTFIIHAYRGGLAWFKGHDHLIAARDFSGVAELTPGALNPAMLQMTVKADSLEETSDVFTAQQKGIIKKELNEIVLESSRYPDITFTSTNVKGGLKNGQFDVKINGNMTLHGVTRPIEIPASVTLEGDSLRARGEFKLDRSDFNVKATSAFHGMVRVKDGLKFTFDMIGQRIP